MANIQIAYGFVQAARKRRNEILGSLTFPSSPVSIFARLPVESPSIVVGVSGSSMDDTTALVSATPLPYPSSGSTSLLNHRTTQLDTPALPMAHTSLAPSNLKYGPQPPSPPIQTSTPLHRPSEPVTITFADVTPVLPLADSEPQQIIHSTISSAGTTKFPSLFTTETVLQEVVTISLSASGSDSNINSGPTVVSMVSPTPTMDDTGPPSYPTDAGRPAAKAAGNVFSYQPTSGTPSSTPTILPPFYPQQDPRSGLNPVAVVGCALAGILSLTVVSFCILWVFRSRRRSRDEKMAAF